MRGFRHRSGSRFKPEDNKITLAQLKNGQSGTVVEIQGGRRMVDRLNALSIIPGKKITKTSSMLMRGPSRWTGRRWLLASAWPAG
jgi:Fe2+ transport system protein FeoA